MLPCAISGTDKVQPTGKTLPRVHRVTVTFGEPLDFSRYAGELWDRGKDAPEGTFTALFRSAAAEAADLAFADFLSTLIILIVAGNETTRNSIIGGVMALAERPDQLARAAADRSRARRSSCRSSCSR